MQRRFWGEDIRGAGPSDAGMLLERALVRLMRAAQLPIGLAALGYCDRDIPSLVTGTLAQRRLLDNAPCAVGEGVLTALFQQALLGEDR